MQAFEHQLPAAQGAGGHRIAQQLQARECARHAVAEQRQHLGALLRAVGQAPGLAQVGQRILRVIAGQRQHGSRPVNAQLDAGGVERPGPLAHARSALRPGIGNAGLLDAEAGDGQVLRGDGEEHQAAVIGLGQIHRLLRHKARCQAQLVGQAGCAMHLHAHMALLRFIKQRLADLWAEQGGVLGHVQVSGLGAGLKGKCPGLVFRSATPVPAPKPAAVTSVKFIRSLF